MTANMTETQKRLFQLLKEIDAICTAHDIPYYLAGGTLIGAIRHKGFIPWDDDLDIMMIRDNWYRFIEACKTDLPPGRVLECQELNRDYTNTFGRYTDTTSTAIHKTELIGGGAAGFVIDVLPLDPLPDEKSIEQYFENMLLYSDLINTPGMYSYRFGVNKERYHDALERIENEGREAVLGELEEAMFGYSEEESKYYVLRWGGVPFLFEKDMFGSSRREEFEGLMCGVPDKISEYLVRHFGDEWTTIPPHDEQVVHNAIFSVDIDYETFQNDYLPLVDVDDIRRQWIKRKKYYFDEMDKRLKTNRDIAAIKAEMHRMELERKIKLSDVNVDEVLKGRQYDLLSELFADYFAAQWNRELIGREDFGGIQRFVSPILIDVPDNIFHAAMETLLYTYRISKADRLIDVWEFTKGKLTPKLLKIKEIIKMYRKVISDYDIGLVEEAEALAEKLLDENPGFMGIEMFLCKAYIEHGEFEKAKKLLDVCLKKYPDDGYFTKYLGDYYLKVDKDTASAVKCYEEARLSTENGMVLLEIEEEMRRING